MHKRFLEGYDCSGWGIDYDEIDADEALDDSAQITRDEEDKYFDSEVSVSGGAFLQDKTMEVSTGDESCSDTMSI